MDRRASKVIQIGSQKIGGNNPILVQSMLNVPAENIGENVKQAWELEQAGAEILRVAIPNMQAVQLVEAIKSHIQIPLVAD
ncbi:MAG: flavodoxin-dependent (E)-4-hydroxy-3-methylbut-2-enyl-diphosphate synthase, partial [Clostridia bacterium]|nr:flavodoxin-dependent (E)-4-hydroxy-3-methylbut-2-enyl-diphosphate synthase [Clostridia bacterium]